jgi:predicted small metal-binding protein
MTARIELASSTTRQLSVASEQTGRRHRRTEMKTRLSCPCGELIRGEDEDDLVEKAFAHLREKHPDMADEYEREHILFMAY